MSFTECLNATELELQNDFKEHKLYSRFLYNSYSRLHKKGFSLSKSDFEKKSKKVETCSTLLDFGHTNVDTVKLVRANFCKDRLCPMCAWRRSKKVYNQVRSCVEYLKDDYQFSLLTLTVPNVFASSLSDTITHMNKAFSNMLKFDAFKSVCKGYIKVLEITYNHVSDTYHPHFHVFMAVDKDYFRSDYYLKTSDYLSMWQEATGDHSITQVDIRKIRYNARRPELSDIASAVAEVAKYTVKPSDYIFPNNSILTDVVVYTLSTVLYHRRLISFGGVFDDVHKILFPSKKKNSDPIDGDLVNTDSDVKEDVVIVAVCRYHWAHGKYQLYSIILPDFCLSSKTIVSPETGEVLVE